MTHLIRSLFIDSQIVVESGQFEIDETYVGGQEKNKHESRKTKQNQGRSMKTKVAVMGVINKKTGKVRTFIAHKVNGEYVRELVSSLIKSGSSIHTDKAIFY